MVATTAASAEEDLVAPCLGAIRAHLPEEGSRDTYAAVPGGLTSSFHLAHSVVDFALCLSLLPTRLTT